MLEITEICDRTVKRGGPALLFEQPVGSTIPVAINTFGSMRRMCLALGVDSLDDLGRQIQELVALPQALPKMTLSDKLKAGFEALGLLPKLKPKMVSSARCQEVGGRATTSG